MKEKEIYNEIVAERKMIWVLWIIRSNLSEITENWKHKSDEQKVTTNNLKMIFKAREKFITLFDCYLVTGSSNHRTAIDHNVSPISAISWISDALKPVCSTFTKIFFYCWTVGFLWSPSWSFSTVWDPSECFSCWSCTW